MTTDLDGLVDNIVDLNPEPNEAFHDGELRFIQSIVRNSQHSIKPRKVTLHDGKKQPTPNLPLSIATISTSLSFDPDNRPNAPVQHFKAVQRKAERYTIFGIDDRISLSEIKEFLTQAIFETGEEMREFESVNGDTIEGDRIHRLIIINEFGFPFPLEPHERVAFLDELEDRMVNVEDPAFWNSCYIVFGSYHCHDQMTNNAVVSLPYWPNEVKKERRDASIESSLHLIADDYQQEDRKRFAFTQEKFAPAEKVGEKLRPKDKIEWVYYDTDMGRIALLICFDALDPRMLIRLTLMQLRDTDEETNRFAAIIVPSFSANDVVRESCRSLSGVMKTLIVYVNFQYSQTQGRDVEFVSPDTHRPKSHGYFYCGKELKNKDVEHTVTAPPIAKAVNEDKNLWYSVANCIVNRGPLNAEYEPSKARSDLFKDLFDPSQ